MKKKLFVIGLLVLTLMFSACGKSESTDSSKSGTNDTNGTNTTNAGSEIKSADDLEGKVLGTQLGATGGIFAADVKDAKVEEYNKGADAIQALKQGKIDCVIIDEQPAIACTKGEDSLVILDEPFTLEDTIRAFCNRVLKRISALVHTDADTMLLEF